MPPISMLIKPVSGLCNLSCKYCFYRDITQKRSIESYGIMSEEVLELIVMRAIAQSEGVCSFAFQGGEPILAGIDFYRKVIKLQNRYKTVNVEVINSIQTNATLVNEEWAKFFKENNFLVGLSLDGYEQIHNEYRVFDDGEGSFDRVLRAVRLFNKYNVEYNILSVVTAKTCENTERVYEFYKANGLRYLQFIPCMDPVNEERGGKDYSLTPEKYKIFLKTLFDCWYRDFMSKDYVSIRFFDNLVGIQLGIEPESCSMRGICSCCYTIEADGSVFPCDFYVLDEFRLGNIKNRGFKNLANQPQAKQFIEQSELIHRKCSGCKYYSICRGGCRRDRLDGLKENYYCDALYDFFEYSFERIKEVAKMIKGR